MDRRSTSVETTAYLLVILVTIAAVLSALGLAAWNDLRKYRQDLAAAASEAAPRVAQALRSGDAANALQGSAAIAAAQLYAADGRLLGEAGTRGAGVEIVCSRTAAGDTLCLEQAAAPYQARLRSWLVTLGVGAAAALVLGLLGGMLLRRALGNRLAPLGRTVERAVRERDYSQRVAEPAGALGALTASMNSLLGQMQERELELKRRTADVESANKELEAFVYAVSHDLRAPLGSIDGFAQALEADWSERLDEPGREALQWIRRACGQMRDLVDGLLEMSRLARAELQQDDVDLSALARAVADGLQQQDPRRTVRFHIRDGVRTVGDSRLLRAVLENLMGNAWKFTRGREPATIEFGMTDASGAPAFYVRDNGAGFDPSHASKMFRPFQRLHSNREFDGTGIGLATVHKIALRHGGKAWAEGEVGKGATIYFTTT